MKAWVAIAAGCLIGSAAAAEEAVTHIGSERSHVVALKLGNFKPMIDAEFPDVEGPYNNFFGGKPMLMFQLEAERIFWEGFGTLSAGLSAGYAEKYGRTRDAVTGDPTQESSSLRVVPLRALAAYRFDWAVQRYGIPLVPYLKAGVGYTLWSATDASGSTTGTDGEATASSEAKGGKWGYMGIAGIAFLLDVLEPRLAKDADSDLGINHFYFFAEYVYDQADDFGKGGLNLSSRRWMFGLALEF